MINLNTPELRDYNLAALCTVPLQFYCFIMALGWGWGLGAFLAVSVALYWFMNRASNSVQERIHEEFDEMSLKNQKLRAELHEVNQRLEELVAE